MFVYKKTDKNKERPVHYSEAVRYKSLYNKALKIQRELREYFLSNNLMFEGEDEETRREIYKAIDHLKSFMDNLKLKDEYAEE